MLSLLLEVVKRMLSLLVVVGMPVIPDLMPSQASAPDGCRVLKSAVGMPVDDLGLWLPWLVDVVPKVLALLLNEIMPEFL